MPSKKSKTPDTILQTAKPSDAEMEFFILRYVATIADDAASQIANLAASMSSFRHESNPAALVSQAIQIREAAAVALPAHRSALLKDADWSSLNSLYHRIGEGKTDAQKKKDPHMIAIIEAMKRRTQKDVDAWQKAPERDTEKADLEAVFAAVEAASGPRPSLPCPLEKALRWSISANDSLSCSLLEGAFVDFLEILTSREKHKRNFMWGRSDAAAGVERYEQALADPDLPDESRKSHEEELVKYQKIVAEESTVAAYAESFTPGTLAPDSIAGTGAATYATHWKGKTVDEKNLHFFAYEFRAFWEKHGQTYQAIQQEQERTANERRKSKKAAGKASAAPRERDRWVRFTQNFVEWAGQREVTSNLINSYPKQSSVELAKGRAFLRTLLNAKSSAGLKLELADTLEQESIKLPASTGQRIAMDCYSILNHRSVL